MIGTIIIYPVLAFIDAEDVDKVLIVLDKVFFGAAKWNDLGLRLGLYQPKLNVIADGGGDAYRHLRKTIEAWLDGEDKAKIRTWQTLIDAVRGTGNRAAAEKIPQKLKELYNITV
uniref:Death domain-containing protein n=1 Tax=Amphimedon queenslandica TaxID=400682 RepID=A0A1X7SMA6_AMPQE